MPRILVLVLDDHPSLRRNLMALLEDEGFDVIGAESGEHAMQLMRDIDIAIVDIRLPGMSGNEFILAAHAQHPELKFIIHTGVVGYSLPDALRNIGLTDESVFAKPLADPDALFMHLRKIHSRR